jgi:hypothetical protein
MKKTFQIGLLIAAAFITAQANDPAGPARADRAEPAPAASLATAGMPFAEAKATESAPPAAVASCIAKASQESAAGDAEEMAPQAVAGTERDAKDEAAPYAPQQA